MGRRTLGTPPLPKRWAGMHPIKVGPRDLVLFGGLPGAGKSTLLAGLRNSPVVTVRDSDQMRECLRAWLPARLPYRAYRPLVHVGHQLRVVLAVLRAPGPVLVHDPATRAYTRVALAWLAWISGRPAVFVWLDVSPRLALEGQRARGRLIPPRSFARHVARADVLSRALLAGAVPSGWRAVVLLERPAMGSGLKLVIQGDAVIDASGAATH
ncbi:MAG: AAA family ATPase [Pseudonocardiaceae bacterium]